MRPDFKKIMEKIAKESARSLLEGGAGSGFYGHEGNPPFVGGSKPLSLKDISNHREKVKTLSLEDLSSLLSSGNEEERRNFVLRTLGEWDADLGPGQLRQEASKLLKLSVGKEPLAFLHPGEFTLYRGGKIFSKGTPVSWSMDKEYAKTYGEITSKKITRNDPAISLDKLMGVNMKEIISFI